MLLYVCVAIAANHFIRTIFVDSIYIYVMCVLSHSVTLRPHGLDSPWNSPGQNTGVDSCREPAYCILSEDL